MKESSRYRVSILCQCSKLQFYVKPLTNKVAVVVRIHTRLFHSLVIHLLMRLTHKSLYPIVTIRHPLKQIFNLQQLYHTLPVRDIRICEEPHSDFAGVDVFEEFPEIRIVLDYIFQW
jgi:hypothetical protein